MNITQNFFLTETENILMHSKAMETLSNLLSYADCRNVFTPRFKERKKKVFMFSQRIDQLTEITP